MDMFGYVCVCRWSYLWSNKMTQGFDEFFKENFEDGLSSPSKYMLKFTFEAGAKSRQAEIDGLQRKLNLCEALRNNQFEHLIEITEQRDTSQKSVIELQKRINEALKYVSESPLKDVSRKAMLNFLDILKGNQND